MSRRRSNRKTVPTIVVLLIAIGVAWYRANPQRNPASARESGVPAATAKTSASVAAPSGGGTAAPGAYRDPNPDVLVLGTWNIEWLGKPDQRSGPARGVAQSPDDLADYIAASGAEILALEEIVTFTPGSPIRSPELEAVLEALAGKTGASWDYVLFQGRAKGDQLTGVMWNASAVAAQTTDGRPWDQLHSTPHRLPIEEGRSAQGTALWNRPPHAMRFSAGPGRTDLVLIPVHMKADYRGKFESHRAAEAEALAKALPAVRTAFADQDVVVLGDSNAADAGEACIRSLVDAGLIDLNRGNEVTHVAGYTMDRIMPPQGQPEFANSRQRVFSTDYLSKRRLTETDFKTRYSDHFMVLADVRVMPDDD
ncbi:MAG TPA: endonuclease/exonuclease/phosphatase family protein [Phycisphaerales bacterium]|nr:endonuclease/exonuclease/phosphatase family protein [Phycisphaerales bacterium]